jgi:glycosyltransferase involved in cell wall biosynthesis
MPSAENILLMCYGLHAGGTERQLTKVAVALDRARFHPHVACLRSAGDNGFYAPELRAAGVPVIELPVRSFKSWSVVDGYRALRNYVRRQKIVLAHAFDVPMDIFGVPAARLARVPVVLASQRAHRNLTPGASDFLLRISDRLSHGVVVNCIAMRDHVVHDYRISPDAVHLCYNGIDTDVFHPGLRRRMPALEGKSIVIGVVCVLRAEKNLRVLLDAFARVRGLGQGLQLVIAGDGPERPDLERHSRNLGLGPDCMFTGTVQESAAWMRSIDIFVLPSSSEALSNSLMEAMACGCAPIASRVGGNPELVEHEVNGLLFENNDAEGLAHCLRRLIESPDLQQRFAERSLRAVEDRFSLRASVRRMASIYEEVLAVRSGSRSRPEDFRTSW